MFSTDFPNLFKLHTTYNIFKSLHSQYAGKWYEMFRYEQPFELAMECVTATYTKGATNVGVFNQGVVKNKLFGINGTAVVNSTTEEGKLLVTFPTSECFIDRLLFFGLVLARVCSCWKLDFFFHFSDTSASNYWVLNTDYTSFSVVYSCQSINTTSRSSKCA